MTTSSSTLRGILLLDAMCRGATFCPYFLSFLYFAHSQHHPQIQVAMCTCIMPHVLGCRDGLLGKRQTHNGKVVSLNPSRSSEGIFFSNVNLCADSYFSIWCPFHLCVITVASKRPWSFCQQCRWQVTAIYIVYTLDPMKLELADCAAVQAQRGNLSGNKLTHNSSGNTWPQLSQLAKPLWTDPGVKSRIIMCELIST